MARAVLLRLADGVTEIERRVSVHAIPCEVWHVVEEALVAHGGVVRAYGFGPDGPWRGWRLGFAGAARMTVHDPIHTCLNEPSSDEQIPTRLPDLEGLEPRRELWRWSCETSWNLDRSARSRFQLSLVDAWGLRHHQTPATRWGRRALRIAA